MPYEINNSVGTKLVSLKDGTIDTTTTDLALFGKGYAGFGERLNENFVKLLENFSHTTQPTNKIKGQLWYDASDNQIKVWNGSKFKPVGSTSNATSNPSNSNTGDFWFDTTNNQLYVYNGSTWVLIGPTSVAGSGVTNFVPETVANNVGVNKNILKAVTNDNVVFVVSSENFTPESTAGSTGAALVAAGFSQVYKGITLSTSISDNKLQGTSTDSDKLGGVAAASFLRSDQNDTTTGTLGILNDTGLTIGADSDLTLSVSGANTTIKNATSNGDMNFQINDGGVTKTPLMIDGATAKVIIDGDLEVKGTQTIINTTTLAVEDNIIELNRNVSVASAMPTYTGLKINRGEASSNTEQDLYWVWDESFADDGTSIHGNAGGAFTAFRSASDSGQPTSATLVDVRANIVHATSTSAQYADLAERYACDMHVQPGDVVILGGKKEVTKCTEELDTAVFGVVSESPAFLMNATAGNNDSHPMITLKGRVMVKVSGKGQAGTRIVSGKNGVARTAELEECTAFNTLGRLITDKYNEDTEMHECVIGVK